MSLLKLAAEQAEKEKKEKSKKRKWAEGGAMLGGGIGAATGAASGYLTHPYFQSSNTGQSRGLFAAKNGLAGGLNQAVGGAVIGLGAGAIQDRKLKKKKAEQE